MIINDLLVKGSARVVDKIYANKVEGDLIGNADSASVATELGTQPQLTSKSAMDGFLSGTGVRYATFNTSESGTGFQSNDGMILSLPWANSTSYGTQLAFDDAKVTNVAIRGKSETWGDWYRLLHTGNWSNYITNVASATKISKCVRISSSSTTNVGKCIKFASVDISSGTWNSCAGYLIFSPMESDVGCRGILHFFLRTSSTNAEQTGSLRWVSLANNDHAGSVIVVKTAAGKFDIYFKPKYQYETTEVTAIFNEDVDNISLTNSGTYVDESTLTSLYVSSLHSVSSSCTGNAATATSATTAATADFLNYKWNNEINFAGGNTTGRVLINYRNKETASTSGNANPITSYEFFNTNGSISGVKLKAETFEGNATSATALTTNAGDSNTPVYFSGGKPVACTSLDLNTTGNAATATKAYVLQGTYTSNGGAQPPSYVGANSVKCNMMNNFVGTSVSFSNYADVLMMNAYSWSDVPYATALAIQKTNGIPRAWIAAGGNTDAWSGATEIITKNNIGSQSVSSATKATQDASGNVITSTYATKTELANKVKIVRW